MYDEQPDDPHGECRVEIARLQALLAAALVEVERLLTQVEGYQDAQEFEHSGL